MNNNQLQLNHQFLTDKKWWIEETDQEYILFVKHNGETYQASREKKVVDFGKKIGDVFILKTEVHLLIFKIKLQIAKDKLKQYEQL